VVAVLPEKAADLINQPGAHVADFSKVVLAVAPQASTVALAQPADSPSPVQIHRASKTR
jgi:hypothetical protein